MSSNKRNSVFSGVVPVMGEAQTTIPLAAGSKVLSQVISEALAETNPIARHSTGSILLDSFIGDAANEAFALQTELSSLSLELKRIQNPRFKRATVSPERKAAYSTVKPAEASSRNRSKPTNNQGRRLAEIQRTQAQRAKNNAPASPSTQPRIAAKSTHEPDKSAADRALNGALNRALNKAVNSAARSPVTVSPAVEAPRDVLGADTVPSQPAPRIKVFGGSDYKALQAKAEAGGLVNLDDSLLFGGTEQEASRPGVGSTPVESSFLTYLSEKIEDFTASPVKGGLHSTAHLSSSDSAKRFDKDAWCRTVLGLDTFKLGDLETEASSDYQKVQGVDTQLDTEASHISEQQPAELNDLGRQVIYLNQRIEYLSRRLSELAEAGSGKDDKARQSGQRSGQRSEQQVSAHTRRNAYKNHGPVVMGLEFFAVNELKEHRIATLDTLSAAL